MNDDVTSRTRPSGREVSILAFGDTASAVELAALDEARAFFGADLQLEIVPAYQAWPVPPGSVLASQAGGKKFYARVVVRTVES